MAKINKTTFFLMECMADALIRQLRSRSIEKITVEDIVEMAGVGRSTYFRNFTSKQEMLSFKYVWSWKHWIESNEITLHSALTAATAREILSFFYSFRDTTQIIYKAHQQECLFQAIQQIVADLSTISPSLRTNSCDSVSGPDSDTDTTCVGYAGCCYSYALWGVLNEWIRRGYRESIDEIMNDLSQEFLRTDH